MKLHWALSLLEAMQLLLYGAGRLENGSLILLVHREGSSLMIS